MSRTPATLDPAVASRIDDLSDALIASGAGRRGAPLVSVWLGDLDGGTMLARDVDAAHYAASTMKLPLLVAAHRRQEAGELDLARDVAVHNRFASAADGSGFSLEQDDDQDDETWAALGSRRTLAYLAEHTTVKSGNLATNLLLEHVGAGAVADVLADAGCSAASVISRGIGDAAARDAGLDNLVTAADLGRVVRGVADGTLAAPETCAAVLAVLARQEHRDGIPAGLPGGTYVANKTGSVDGVNHDVALVRSAGRAPYILVVLTTVDVPEDEATSFIAALSRTVWEGWQQ
ncbi:MAG: serine hydrolase [Nocardioides sp.]